MTPTITASRSTTTIYPRTWPSSSWSSTRKASTTKTGWNSIVGMNGLWSLCSGDTCKWSKTTDSGNPKLPPPKWLLRGVSSHQQRAANKMPHVLPVPAFNSRSPKASPTCLKKANKKKILSTSKLKPKCLFFVVRLHKINFRPNSLFFDPSGHPAWRLWSRILTKSMNQITQLWERLKRRSRKSCPLSVRRITCRLKTKRNRKNWQSKLKMMTRSTQTTVWMSGLSRTRMTTNN